MAMGTGAKIAIGCGCLVLLGGAAVVGVVGWGAWWAKGKITEATGGLEQIAAKADEISRYEEKANANAYTPPADGVIPEARLVKFLDARKRVYAVYERYEADLRELQKTSQKADDKLSPSDLWSAGGKLAEVFGAIRLEQMKALAELGMSESEYRDIQLAVYKTRLGLRRREAVRPHARRGRLRVAVGSGEGPGRGRTRGPRGRTEGRACRGRERSRPRT